MNSREIFILFYFILFWFFFIDWLVGFGATVSGIQGSLLDSALRNRQGQAGRPFSALRNHQGQAGGPFGMPGIESGPFQICRIQVKYPAAVSSLLILNNWIILRSLNARYKYKNEVCDPRKMTEDFLYHLSNHWFTLVWGPHKVVLKVIPISVTTSW